MLSDTLLPRPRGLATRPPRRAVLDLGPDGDVRPSPGPPGGLAIWPYTQDRRAPFRLGLEMLLDPVNVIVAGAPPRQVIAALTAMGWRRPRVAGVHRTWIHGRLVLMDHDLILGTEEERFHVRVWRAGRCTLAAAHYEVPGRRVRHVVTSWDGARAKVACDLADSGFDLLGATEAIVPRDLRGLPCDGRAFRLRAPAGARGAEAAG